MSDILNKIPLIDITAPELNQSNYGSDLSQTFENIDKNFSTLANYDFIKGESGKSVIIEEVSFYNEDGSLNKYGHKVKEYFINNYGEDALKSIYDLDGNEISIYDNFTKDNAGNLYIISMIENDTTNESTPVSSLYYIFLDGRFANSNLANIDEKSFADIDDLSCLLIYDKHIDGFKPLEGAFPTIYYEQDRGLCWNINGKETGLQIRGITGKDGKSAELRFVECEQSSDNSTYKETKVISVYNYPEKTPVHELSPEEISECDNSMALILIKNEQEQKHYLYFGKIKLVGEELYANYFDNMELTYNLQAANLINTLKKIDILSNDNNPLRGIFIPINNESNQKQSVHLLTANSITSGDSDLATEDKVDVMFTGIDNIDTLTAHNEEKQLLVEKYLYVKVNTKRDFFTNSIYKTISDVLKAQCGEYNYVLKYKLSDKVIKYDALDDFKPKTFGKFKVDNSTISFKDGENGNIKYINPNDSNSFYEHNEHYETLPAEFKLRMQHDTTEYKNANALGVYIWELCDAENSFDSDIINTENQLSYSSNLKNYFGHILTTTINPNINTNFVWFNGLELYFDDNGNYKDNDKYILYGWNEDVTQPMFSFEKFVPIFNNDFRYNGDTSLNINYNINITGDDESPNRNVTINGALNADNVNIHNTAKIGKIEDVYTENDITSDAGIKIGKKTYYSQYPYNCTIDKDGNARFEESITAKKLSINENITSNKITSNDSLFKNVTIGSSLNNLLTLNSKLANIGDGSITVPPSNQPDMSSAYSMRSEVNNETSTEFSTISSLEIAANKVESINISRLDDESVIKSNMTSLYTDSSGIIVSNDDDAESNQFCCYGDKNDNLTENVIAFNYGKMQQVKNYTPITLNYEYSGNIESFNDAAINEKYLIGYSTAANESHFAIKYTTGSVNSDIITTPYNDYFIQKHIIKQPNEQTNYDEDYWANIYFGYFSFVLCISTEHTWDRNLHKAVRLITKDNYVEHGETEYSYVKLRAYYKDSDGKFVEFCTSKEMPFPTQFTTLEDNVTKTDAWYGVGLKTEQIDSKHYITDINNSPWKNRNSTELKARAGYQGYIFKPSRMITYSNAREVFKTMFNQGKDIEIYVRPEINIIVKSPSGNNKINGVYVYDFVPLGNDVNIYSRAAGGKYNLYSMNDDTIEETYDFKTGYVVKAFNATGKSHPVTWSLNKGTLLSDSYIKYKTFIINDDTADNKFITNICSDGIVIRDNSKMFGLGNIDSSPSLFYYDKRNLSDKNKGLRYIRLEELFDNSDNSLSPLKQLIEQQYLE